jgi:type IV pilus assembly protein PilO
MAAKGFLKEFAGRPTGFKVAVFALVGLVLGGAYFQLKLKPLRKQYAGAQQDNDDLIARGKKLDRDLIDYRKLQTRSDELKRQIEENQKALPTQSELPSFFETLNRKVRESGVEVRKWDYKKDLPVDNFVKVPVEIEISGNFYQVKRFFSSLVQRGGSSTSGGGSSTDRERIITVENMRIESNPGTRDNVLKVKFTASTFRQEDAKPATPPPVKGPAPAAAPGTAPAAAPGTAPAPAATTPAPTTPAGVQVRVEGAMQADEKRSGSPSGPESGGSAPAGGSAGGAAGDNRPKGGI